VTVEADDSPFGACAAEWANHVYERRCASMARQLYGEGMAKDTDQVGDQ
jgi:hypothetical protein